MFPVVPGLIGLYLVVRYIARLRVAMAVRAVLSLLLMALISHHWLVARFAGSIASPEIPRGAIMGLSWAFGALMMFAFFLLLKDIAGGVLWLFSRVRGRAVLAQRGYVHVVALVCAAFSAVGVYNATRVPEVHAFDLTIPGLDARYDGYRLVHLTDLHTSRLLQGPWLAEVVSRTNALNPDLILISGDLVDGTPQARALDYPALGKLAAKDGVFGVTGNHEYYNAYKEWLTVFQQQGIRMLMNEHVVLERDGAHLVVAGVNDTVSLRWNEPGPDIARALAGRPAGAPVILMDHRPGNARENRAAGADLQLSGHTHGGHILGLHLLVAQFNGGFVSGLYPVDGGHLYVSNGAGLWPGFAQRLGKRSEIVEITLRAPRD